MEAWSDPSQLLTALVQVMHPCCKAMTSSRVLFKSPCRPCLNCWCLSFNANCKAADIVEAIYRLQALTLSLLGAGHAVLAQG